MTWQAMAWRGQPHPLLLHGVHLLHVRVLVDHLRLGRRACGFVFFKDLLLKINCFNIIFAIQDPIKPMKAKHPFTLGAAFLKLL